MDLLPDPCGDRAVKKCPLPPNKPLTEKILFPNSGNHIKLTDRRGQRCSRLVSCERLFGSRRSF